MLVVDIIFASTPVLNRCSEHGSCKWVLSLLLVSRAVSHESERHFFSGNSFQVQESAPGSLHMLSALSATALYSMTSLTIQIRACRCPLDFGNGTGCANIEEGCEKGHLEHIEPLDIAFPKDRKIVLSWTAIAARLADFVSPNLELKVLSDQKMLRPRRK